MRKRWRPFWNSTQRKSRDILKKQFSGLIFGILLCKSKYLLWRWHNQFQTNLCEIQILLQYNSTVFNYTITTFWWIFEAEIVHRINLYCMLHQSIHSPLGVDRSFTTTFLNFTASEPAVKFMVVVVNRPFNKTSTYATCSIFVCSMNATCKKSCEDDRFDWKRNW